MPSAVSNARRMRTGAVPFSIVAATLAWLPVIGHAQLAPCTSRFDVSPSTFDARSIPRDAPTGSPLTDVRPAVISVSCPRNSGGTGAAGFYLRIYSRLSVSSIVRDAWESGTPGIGIRATNLDYPPIPFLSQVNAGTYTEFGPVVAANADYSGTFRFTFQLIKTGQVTGSGQVNVATMYTLRSHNIPANVTSADQAPMALGSTPFVSRTCTVLTPAVSVQLPTVGAATLDASGQPAGRTPFSVGLRCDTGASVYITLTDVTNPGNRTDQLSLTANSTARGVALRLRNPSVGVISFGADSAVAGNTSQWLVGPSDTTSSIPMTAEYVTTGPVTPGTVQGVATFTMSYQ